MKKEAKKLVKKDRVYAYNSSGGAVYGLGFIGAVVYYISNATGFWVGVFGILKALVWPAFMVYNIFKFLGI